jgi:hypothetical protein
MVFSNPYTGTPVFKQVYTKESLGIHQEDPYSPDLVLGYFRGIRSSWDTAIGATPKETVVARTGKWSGDHFFDASEVPGVLFTLPKLTSTPQSIQEVMPKVLEMLAK